MASYNCSDRRKLYSTGKVLLQFLTEVLHQTMICSEIYLFTVVLNKLSDQN